MIPVTFTSGTLLPDRCSHAASPAQTIQTTIPRASKVIVSARAGTSLGGSSNINPNATLDTVAGAEVTLQTAPASEPQP